MNTFEHADWSRRELLERSSALAMAGLLGFATALWLPSRQPRRAACASAIRRRSALAPQYLAGELLRDGGLHATSQYLALGTRAGPDALAEGSADMAMWYATGFLPVLDAGKPVVAAGRRARGCWELFGHENVRTIRDLKGKTVVCEKYLEAATISCCRACWPTSASTRDDVKWLSRPGARVR